MGGEYTTRTYDGKMSKEQIKKQVACDTQEMNYENGSGSYSGHWGVKNGGVDFCSTTFSSEDKADDWLSDNNDKWGSVGACYIEEKMGTDTQNEKIKTQRTKVRETESSINVALGQFLTKKKNGKGKKCTSCGISVVAGNVGLKCPACGTSFLTDTENKKIGKIKVKIEAEKTKLETLISKRGGKTVKKWLCGGWCSS